MYLADYRIAYIFKQDKNEYQTLVAFMLDSGIMELDRRFSSSLEYSNFSGAIKKECDQLCDLWGGVTAEKIMIRIGVPYIHGKYWSQPFDSLFFELQDSDRVIGYRKGWWWSMQKWQTTYGGTFVYSLDENWIILRWYDRDRNPKPEKYDQ
jgi:hypothetical protein